MTGIGTRIAVAVAAALLISGPVLAGPPQVKFGDRIEKNLAKIDAIEQRLEERFRRFRHDRPSESETVFRLNRSRYAGMEWAGERLITNVEDFTLGNVAKAMIVYNLDRLDAAQRQGTTVRLTIERFKVKKYDIAVFSSHSTYMQGRVELVDDATGNVLQAHDVSVDFLRLPTVDRDYTGDDLAFFTTDPDKRVGPVLGQFVAKALGKVYSGGDFARVLVIFDDGNT